MTNLYDLDKSYNGRLNIQEVEKVDIPKTADGKINSRRLMNGLILP